MTRWPLLLPPPAVSISTSPSHSRGSLSSIVIEPPSCHPLPLSCCCPRDRVVPRHHAAPSITLNTPLRHPSLPIVVVLSFHLRHTRAVPRQQGAVAPSLAVKEPSRHPLLSPSRSHRAIPRPRGAVAPSIAVVDEEPSHHPLPWRSCRTVHCHRRQGAIAPSLAVEEPLRRPLPSRCRRTIPCHQGAVGRVY